MKRISFLLIILFVVSIQAQNKIHRPEITAEEIKANVFYLASDAMKGRFTGSPEERIAGDYIKSEFQLYGLKPAFNGNWFQEFPFIERVEMTKANSLSFDVKGKKQNLKTGNDYTTVAYSGKGKINGDLVFAGYGISAPKLNYDDYEGIDVKGKTVVVMRYHPEHDSSRSEFDKYASFRNKATVAKEKGAVAIILVNGFAPKNYDDQLMELHYDGAPAMKGISVQHVKRSFVEDLFKIDGLSFVEAQKQIDALKKPSSFAFKNAKVSLSTEVKEIEKKGRNVAGMIEGSDPVLKNEFIVIGAHYDHLGIDQLKESSMYKGNDKQIHNGADDNASGTTGVLEVAEKFGSMQGLLKRSIIFVAFSGEELGILGSTYMTNNFPVDIKNVDAMLNMDMIGRLNEENSLTIIGSGTSSMWKELLNQKNSYSFKLGMSDGGSGGSDHQAFSNKNIPVLFFFTGTHSDYHKPSDKPEKINCDGEAKVANYVFDIALAVDNLEKRPDYVKVEEPAQRGGDGGKTRVTVGTIPEFGFSGTGYKLSGVTEGSPAAKAGMKAGDIIVKFGPKTVANIYDFMYAVQDYKAGDKVDVVVQRDGKEMTFNVELIAK
ncbi:MAG: M20/M25/M40 family metallo-hydrolase [Ignavibacteriales bacterium]|nr:M20/M25/M40 family metallo-hydrolase [Ignavibacteriales bacterium]